jgi:hypothetical protein
MCYIKKMKKTLSLGFFEKYNRGKKNSTIFVTIKKGLLRLRYSSEGEILHVHLVKKRGGSSIGEGLEFSEGLETVTYISENGVSGEQWHNGRVIWGATYEEVDSTQVANDVPLNKWIDKKILKMVNQKV